MGGKGSGRPKEPKRLAREALDSVDIDKLLRKLDKWADGKPVICPHCLKNTGAYIPDTVSLQSALELLNRTLGKVPQSVQLDITETIQLDADQVMKLIERYQIATRAMLPEVIEGEVIDVQE